MPGPALVHLRTVSDPFHARVIAARLGADGIPTQLRSDSSLLYPFGAVSVWVVEADAQAARELLLADEVDAVFVPHPDDEEPSRSRRPFLLGLSRRQLLAGASLVLMVGSTVAARLFS